MSLQGGVAEINELHTAARGQVSYVQEGNFGKASQLISLFAPPPSSLFVLICFLSSLRLYLSLPSLSYRRVASQAAVALSCSYQVLLLLVLWAFSLALYLSLLSFFENESMEFALRYNKKSCTTLLCVCNICKGYLLPWSTRCTIRQGMSQAGYSNYAQYARFHQAIMCIDLPKMSIPEYIVCFVFVLL